MKKRKLRGFVLPTIYLFTLAALVFSVVCFSKNLFNGSDNDYDYTIESITNDNLPVVSTVESESTIIEPIKDGTANINVYFYSKDDDNDRQTNSLISYGNTYFKSTGLLYASEEEFDVVSVLDGTVTNIKNDDILGTVVEIENSSNVKIIYSSLKSTFFKEGDTIKQGDIIGLSGTNKLNDTKSNNLYFEVYHNGTLIDPLKFYEMNLNEL